MTQLNINLVVEKLAREKITEWKHEGIPKLQKNAFFLEKNKTFGINIKY